MCAGVGELVHIVRQKRNKEKGKEIVNMKKVQVLEP